MPSYQDYISALKQEIQPVFKYVMLNPDETIAYEFTDDVINDSGQIQANLQNGTRRSCTVKLDNYLSKWIPDVRTGFWVNSKFQIFCGLNINGVDYFPPDGSQGVFILKSVEADSNSGSDQTSTITGVDKYGAMNGEVYGKLDKAYETDKNVNLASAVKTLLAYSGDTSEPIISHNFYNLQLPGQVRQEEGQTIEDVMKQICAFASANYYYDTYGHFVVEDGAYDIDDSKKGSAWDFSVNETEYFGGKMTDDFSKLSNIVVVDVNNLQNNVVLTGRAENNNLASPFCIQVCGPRVQTVQDSLITTVDQANQRALYVLKQSMVLARSYELKTSYIPHIKENNVITLSDPNINPKYSLDKARMLVSGITIPLTSNSQMTIETSNVNELGLSVG